VVEAGKTVVATVDSGPTEESTLLTDLAVDAIVGAEAKRTVVAIVDSGPTEESALLMDLAVDAIVGAEAKRTVVAIVDSGAPTEESALLMDLAVDAILGADTKRTVRCLENIRPERYRSLRTRLQCRLRPKSTHTAGATSAITMPIVLHNRTMTSLKMLSVTRKSTKSRTE
jgi:NAD(P)H-hydrate repair Nnr-like enzyme with NAD(P)H-hydrate epimerase domain